MHPTAETLSGVRLFRDLPHDARDAIAKRCRLDRVAGGHEIVQYSGQTDDVYFIVSGRVRATIFSASGKEVAFREIGPGQVFGDLSALDGKPRSASVLSLEPCVLVSMSAKEFWGVIKDYPSVAAQLLCDLTTLVRRLTERVVEFSTLGVKNRVHAELLRLAREHPITNNTGVIRPAPTHAEIATRISTHREAVTRELNHLKEVGVIDRPSGSIIIRDLALLEQMVDEVKGE